MPENDSVLIDYTQTLDELLYELRTLNQNFAAFTEYEMQRDADQDAQDAVITPIPVTPVPTEDPTQDVLVDIQSMLKSIDENMSMLSGNETVDYSETLQTISETSTSVELSSYVQIGCLLVVIVSIAMIIGSEIAKLFFKKW